MELDETDWRILELLQADARLSLSEIGRKVNLSQPSVAERVKRLESSGVICGYHAEIDLTKIGLSISALVRMQVDGLQSLEVYEMVKSMPEVLECHSVTGDDCFAIKVAVTSVIHLEQFLIKLKHFGNTSTSVLLSTPVQRRSITPSNFNPEITNLQGKSRST